jgi:hypothetical protein
MSKHTDVPRGLPPGRAASRSSTAFLRVILCILIAGMLPLHAFVQPAEARGIDGELSKVIPFVGVVVGLRHRNRVYRDANRFIGDRNAYYDGLRETARGQLLKREIRGLRPSQVAAYIKVVALIEQERTAVQDVAEARKRGARSQFQKRFEEAVFHVVSGTHLAQALFKSLRDGVGTAKDVLNRVLSKLTTGGTGILGDIQRIRKIAERVSRISGVFGGKVGIRLKLASEHIMQVVDKYTMDATKGLTDIQGELADLDLTIEALSLAGRVPSAGEIKEHLKAHYLPGDEGESAGRPDSTDISLEAISSVLSQLEVGDGSLRDAAKQKLRMGFVARCAVLSQAYMQGLSALQKSKTEPPPEFEDISGPECEEIEPGDLKKKSEGTTTSTQPEPVETEEPKVEVLPTISANGEFSETLSGLTNTSRPMGTKFTLVANYAAGTISGTLTGGRTTNGNPIQCVDSENASIVLDTAYVDYIDAYQASFSGLIDLESGDFSLNITPKGSTSDRKTTPYTVEGCTHLNSAAAPGSGGWTGEGTISGYVTKDGSIELTTQWTSFGGNIGVTGTWSGVGTVETPES